MSKAHIGDVRLWEVSALQLVLVGIHRGHRDHGLGRQELRQAVDRGLQLLAGRAPGGAGHQQHVLLAVQHQLPEGVRRDDREPLHAGVRVPGRPLAAARARVAAAPADAGVRGVPRRAAADPDALRQLVVPDLELAQHRGVQPHGPQVAPRAPLRGAQGAAALGGAEEHEALPAVDGEAAVRQQPARVADVEVHLAIQVDLEGACFHMAQAREPLWDAPGHWQADPPPA